MTLQQAVTVDASAPKLSRVGKRPIEVPKGTTVTIAGRRVEAKGPKGQLVRELTDGTSIVREGELLQISSDRPGRDGARLQGLERALVASMVKGVSQGFERGLELVGTGYRCELKGSLVTFQVGLSHTESIILPPGVTAQIPAEAKGTMLILSSADKAMLGQLAATIRGFRPPEPYGGKGIRYRGEKVRKKAGKAGKGRK